MYWSHGIGERHRRIGSTHRLVRQCLKYALRSMELEYLRDTGTDEFKLFSMGHFTSKNAGPGSLITSRRTDSSLIGFH